jgi:predicted RNA-binding Zn-ribbon protein involved in translation (DUF1610 family)
MRRDAPKQAEPKSQPPDITLFHPSQGLHYCGFICPHCGYQHRLSDNANGAPILDLFRSDTDAHPLSCPECGALTSYERKDLKLFRNGLD